MATKIQLRRGTAAQWTAADPVLAEGEIGLELDTGKRKIGDGVQVWTALPYDLTQSVAEGLFADKTATEQALDDKVPAARTVAGKPLSDDVVLDKSDVGLNNVANLAPAALPISDATQAAISSKSDLGTVFPRIASSRETVLISMDDATTWLLGVNGNPADTSDGLFSGQHGSRVADSGTSLDFTARLDGGAVDLTDATLRFWVRCDDWSKLSTVTIYLATDATFSSNRNRTMTVTSNMQYGADEWVPITLPVETTSGSMPDFETVGGIRVRFSLDAPTPGFTGRMGGVTNVDTTADAFPNGVVSFTIDDGSKSQYDNLMPILSTRGMQATSYLILDQIGNSAMTLDQVRRLRHIHGWEIGHHATTTSTHDNNYPSLTDDEIAEDFLAAKVWADTYGIGPVNNFAWPHGVSTARTRQIARRYFSSARAVGASVQPFGMAADEMYRVTAFDLSGSGIVTAAKAAIDKAAADGAWLVFMLHVTDPDTSGNGRISVADMAEVADYVVSKSIPVRTVAEVVAAIG